jgi:transcriptional regulator with XRE-family HTH domain
MRHADQMADRRKLLGEHLREVRYAAGYSGRPAFAAVAGVGERSVAAVELGSGGRKVRSAIARALGIEPSAVEDYIAGRTDDLPRPVRHVDQAPPSSPLAEVVAASEEELDRMQRLFERYRPGEGRTFRAWADGVRTAHAEGASILPHGPTESEAG